MGIDKNRKGSGRGSGRDGGPFVALPWSVLDCDAYSGLSHTARSLLTEFARQYVKDNNGRLLASGRYLYKRGWKSAGVIQRAKRELIDAGFVYETVKGHRPNKASWYAITWQNLDKHYGYDSGAIEGWIDARSGYSKIKILNSSKRVGKGLIALSKGVVRPPPTSSDGAISDTFKHPPTLSKGNHLDMPSKTV